jgi:hypothetical protein
MRFLAALSILLLAITAAGAEVKCQGSVSVPAYHPITRSPGFNVASGELPLVENATSEPAEAPHDQAEEPAKSPPAPKPVSTKVDAKGEAPHSVGALCDALRNSAEDTHLPVPFFANLIWQESRLQLDSVSRAGALGIAQFMPQVAVEVGLRDPFDPHQAIPASARFLQALRAQFGNLGFVAAAYNAGAHRVADWLGHGRTLPRETQDYVMHVTGRSVEAWRKSPVNDSQLFFARLLPCRQLPTFADLEQTSLKAMQVAEAQQQAQLQQEKAAAAAAAAAKAAQAAAPKGAKNVGQNVAKNISKSVPAKAAGKLATIAAKETAQRKDAHFAGPDKMARNIHAVRHEPARHLHATHEKRRIA